jgi:hypothetical protein
LDEASRQPKGDSNSMFQSLSIDRQARVFLCQNCKKAIDVSVQQCPYCSTVIDPGMAEAAAEALETMNQACSDSDQVRYLERDVFNSAALGGLLGFLVTTPMKFRWWMRYRAIETDYPDFVIARKAVIGPGSSSAFIAQFVAWAVAAICLIASGILLLLHKW